MHILLCSIWPVMADASALVAGFLLGEACQSVHRLIIQKNALRIGLAACADFTVDGDVLMNADPLHVIFVYPRPFLGGNTLIAVIVHK